MLNTDGINKSNIRAIITAFLINAFILLVCLVLFYPTFETNDDSGIIAIASGIRGMRDPHLVHSNYLLGILVTSLNALIPGVQWWSVLQFVLLFFSYCLITLVFIRNDLSVPRILFITAIVFYFSYEGYVRIQYTKTAGIISAVGLMLIFCGLLRDEINKKIIAAGMLIAVAGSFYRIQAFLSITAIFFSMVVYLLLHHAKSFEMPAKRIVSAVAVGLVLLLIVGGFRVFDRNQYKSEEWSSYLEFDKYRTEVIDYGVPDYDEHKEEYNALGIDETAYNLMKQWTFQDSEKFTAQAFKAIAEFRDKKSINVQFVKTFIKKFVKGALNEESFICALIAASFWLAFGRHRGRNIISITVMCLIIAALNFYLFYAGRFMVHRVDVGIWLSAVLILLFNTILDNGDTDGRAISRTGGAGSIIMIVLCALIVMVFAMRVPWQENLKSEMNTAFADTMLERETIEEIGGDKERLYLTKVGTLKFSEAYGVFDPQPYKIADNIYPLGGWGAATPTFTEVLKEHNVGNPFRDVVGNADIFIIDNDIDSTLAYLRKWYKAEAKAELIKTINKNKIYRIE